MYWLCLQLILFASFLLITVECLFAGYGQFSYVPLNSAVYSDTEGQMNCAYNNIVSGKWIFYNDTSGPVDIAYFTPTGGCDILIADPSFSCYSSDLSTSVSLSITPAGGHAGTYECEIIPTVLPSASASAYLIVLC